MEVSEQQGSTESPKVSPDGNVIANAADQTQELVNEQLERAECMELFLRFHALCATGQDNELDAGPAFLRAFEDAHAGQSDMPAMLERFAGLLADDEFEEEVIKKITTYSEEDDYGRTGIRISTLGEIIHSRLVTPHIEKFETLERDVDACVALPDTPERRQKRATLFMDLARLCSEYRITECDSDRPFLPDPDNYSEKPADLHLSIGGTERVIALFSVPGILRGLRQMSYQEHVADTLVGADHGRIREETLVHGAKTANLRETQHMLPSLKAILERNGISIDIPAFESIPASVYADWKEGKDIDAYLRTAYKWIAQREMYVRSSAVFSEDNKGATGAGVYDTVKIKANASFDEFKAAVTQVYASVERERAVQYRKDIGVESEMMGITLQESADAQPYNPDGSYNDDYIELKKGFMNTSRAYAPDLMDVSTDDDMRPIFYKDRTENQLASGAMSGSKDMHYYQPDLLWKHSGRFCHEHERVAFLGCLLEKAYGVPVQCEFVAGGHAIHLLQTRILPDAHKSTANVTFPDTEPLLVRDATGAMDEELDILPHDRANNGKKGLVVFQRSYFTSGIAPDQYFPAEGAVMILAPSKENGGHIETLCIEKGLVCIFASGNHAEAASAPVQYGQTAHREWMGAGETKLPNITGIGGHTRVRVVCNGMEARIYPPAEKDTESPKV